jgi:hypothetical protein
MPSRSRFNPAPGLADFWREIRRPNPYRWPILGLSALPVAAILYWASGTTVYKDPERPKITYITSYEPGRSDAEIAASNAANQEVKDLRAAEKARIAARKREMYKALGAAAGMDVEKIEREADAARAAEEAREAERRAAFPGTVRAAPPEGEGAQP